MRSRRLIAGRYRLEEQLGAGGMGVVWRATDEELHRVVAVKRALSAEGAHEPQRAKLLKREALAVAKVNHPNVVTLFDVVEGVSPVGRAANPQVLVWRAARGDISESHRGGLLAPVLSALLRPDPRKRPDAAQAKEMLEAVAQGVRVRRPLALARVGVLAILLVVIAGLLSLPGDPETSAAPAKVTATIGSILGDTRTADPCALLVVTLGSQSPDRLCKLVSDIAEPLAAKLPG